MGEDNGFTIFNQSITGAINKQDKLELTIQELNDNGKKVNVICSGETFINSDDERNIKIYSRPKEKRGGTCTLVKDNIAYSSLNVDETYAVYRDLKS